MTEVPSPCVRNCCLNESDICLGCFRSLDEIIAWGSASIADKQATLAAANARKIAHQATRASFNKKHR
ncbi:DUF1289 domain-containing protein [Litorilituus sediminis]|uniref:DUF1289 domain-containing protein n=1 Tax=Litorilituus sediminis TaxID=718192 RepID=A0A4P6P9F0_9GAMM|nr:DUF1289 domain-containing protein [Litorilituus sediminis]QBG36919.1 DUF1289 domain-containing protein [Litorilituus sediminis]